MAQRSPATAAGRRFPSLYSLLAVVLTVTAVYATATQMGAPVQPYDEGLLLTHSYLVQQGALPHRDFYSNYPPGIYLLIASLWQWTARSPWAPRLVGFAAHVAISLLAGRLVGRATDRRFCSLTAAMVLFWLFPLANAPYAWLLALGLSLGALELILLASQTARTVAFFAAGAALSSVACFRHDLFVYDVLALGLCAVVFRPSRPATGHALAFAAGTLVPVLSLWVPLLLRAGVGPVLDDLVFDQVRYVNPGRALPFRWDGALRVAAAILALSGPVLAGVAFRATRGRSAAARAAVVLLGAMSVAVVPHALMRSDLFHLMITVPPAVALGVLLLLAGVERAQARSAGSGIVVLALGTAVLALPLSSRLPREPLRWALWPKGPAPYCGVHADPDRLAAITFVQGHTRPGEPIYVGKTTHRRVLSNEVDFYFFADRPGATRYLQFDPGTVTRDEVQQQMIREIEARRTRLVVLSPCCVWDEPNASRTDGSSRLDDYIGQTFEPILQQGRYTILLRRGAVL